VRACTGPRVKPEDDDGENEDDDGENEDDDGENVDDDGENEDDGGENVDDDGGDKDDGEVAVAFMAQTPSCSIVGASGLNP
jgi:hypothetical protein